MRERGKIGKDGRVSRVYFRPGLTWPSLETTRLSSQTKKAQVHVAAVKVSECSYDLASVNALLHSQWKSSGAV